MGLWLAAQGLVSVEGVEMVMEEVMVVEEEEERAEVEVKMILKTTKAIRYATEIDCRTIVTIKRKYDFYAHENGHVCIYISIAFLYCQLIIINMYCIF